MKILDLQEIIVCLFLRFSMVCFEAFWQQVNHSKLVLSFTELIFKM